MHLFHWCLYGLLWGVVNRLAHRLADLLVSIAVLYILVVVLFLPTTPIFTMQHWHGPLYQLLVFLLGYIFGNPLGSDLRKHLIGQ